MFSKHNAGMPFVGSIPTRHAGGSLKAACASWCNAARPASSRKVRVQAPVGQLFRVSELCASSHVSLKGIKMIQLGSRVRDIITGMHGVAVARTEWLYGCARIGVESTDLKKDGKPSDSAWFDEQRVEQLPEPGFPALPLQQCDIKLGSRVKDKLTGFEGLANARTNWMSGNVTINIEPTVMFEGKPVTALSFEAPRVQLIEEIAPPISKDNSARSGGPQNDPVIN